MMNKTHVTKILAGVMALILILTVGMAAAEEPSKAQVLTSLCAMQNEVAGSQVESTGMGSFMAYDEAKDTLYLVFQPVNEKGQQALDTALQSNQLTAEGIATKLKELMTNAGLDAVVNLHILVLNLDKMPISIAVNGEDHTATYGYTLETLAELKALAGIKD